MAFMAWNSAFLVYLYFNKHFKLLFRYLFLHLLYKRQQIERYCENLSEQGFKCLKTLDFKKFRCIILILFNDLVNKLDRPNPIKKAFEAIKVLH